VPPPQGEAIAAWLTGKRIDRASACGAAGFGRRIALPHYPFDKVRCWYDLQIAHLAKRGRTAGVQPRQPDHPHLRNFDLPAAVTRPEPVQAEIASAPAGPPPPGPTTPAAVRLRPATPSKPATGQEPDVSRTRTVSLRSLHREAVPAPLAAPAAPPPVAQAPVAQAPVVQAPVVQPVPVAQPVLVTQEVAATEHGAALLAEVEADISRLLCGVLYLEPDELDTEQTFQEIGVDSILGVEFVAALNAERQVNIKATALYDYPTPKAFATLLAAELAPAGTPPASAAGQAGEPVRPPAAAESAGLQALLDAVRNDQLSVEQALAALQQLSTQSS
jgi:acyl carrier protein